MASIEVVTPPASEPVTLAEAKDFINLAESSFDTTVTRYIEAARIVAETATSRAFLIQAWFVWLDAWPKSSKLMDELWWDGVRQGAVASLYDLPSAIELVGGRLESVGRISTYGADDVEAIFDPSKYVVDTVSQPGRIALKSGSSWPIPGRVLNGIKLELSVGWSGPDEVPEDLKQGILYHIQAMWNRRGGLGGEAAVTAPIPEESHELYGLYKVGAHLG